jgi:hypothetical protein
MLGSASLRSSGSYIFTIGIRHLLIPDSNEYRFVFKITHSNQRLKIPYSLVIGVKVVTESITVSDTLRIFAFVNLKFAGVELEMFISLKVPYFRL